MQNENEKKKARSISPIVRGGRIEQRGKNRWRASFKHQGILHRAPITFKEKKDAESWLNRNKADIDKAEASGIKWISPAEKEKLELTNSTTVEQLIDLWLNESDSITKESTRQFHRRRMTAFSLNSTEYLLGIVQSFLS